MLHNEFKHNNEKEGKDQESIYNQVPHLTNDNFTGTPYGKVAKSTREHHIQESQEISPFPTGDHKDARNVNWT